MKFIDTNVFVYAADSKNPEKRAIVSEDLNDGQVYCGMKAVDPFKGIG